MKSPISNVYSSVGGTKRPSSAPLSAAPKKKRRKVAEKIEAPIV
jgi:hypothetical protein